MSCKFFLLNARLNAGEINALSGAYMRINLGSFLSLVVFDLIEFDFTFTEVGEKRFRIDGVKSCFGHSTDHLCLTYLVFVVGHGSISFLFQGHVVNLNGQSVTLRLCHA